MCADKMARMMSMRQHLRLLAAYTYVAKKMTRKA
jgi:hypothetical protein